MQKQSYSVAETFGLNINPAIMIEGRTPGSHYVPEIDPNYQFDEDLLADVLGWVKMGCKDPLFLTGPSGAGKTSLMKQVAARLNIPVQEITGHGRMEVPDMIGRVGLIGGDTIYLDGPLTTAYREGHWFLLNELDLLDPSTNAGLNGILEKAPLTIMENCGEVVKAHPDFAFIATGNTAGGGDASGMFISTMRQNAAFMDRFLMLAVDYPKKEVESALLASKVPQLPKNVRDGMVSVANEVRRVFKGEQSGALKEAVSIEVTFSTRTLLRWADLTLFFQNKAAKGISPVHYALDRALAFRAEPSTAQALHQIVQHILGE